MRHLYSFCFYLLLPVVLLRLWWRARKAPAYGRRWAERFGLFPAPVSDKPVIWLHAVSVGETLAALPLIEALLQRYSEAQLVVTTTTPTGSERVRAALGERVFHVYMPYDIPLALGAFLRRINPRLLIIMETELWPNTVAACAARQIPVLLANGRLSAKSARGYRRFAALTRPMLGQLQVAAQHWDDGERLLELGLPRQQLTVTGNIKFDLALDDELRARAAAIKVDWSDGGSRLVWMAASTHVGEDEQVLAAFARLKAEQPNSLLVLVPRHPERFDAVAELCETEGYSVQRRSRGQPLAVDTDILLGDTMGELLTLLGACDMAFIGGSLVATGGHNLIEPAAWGLPILSGPHLFNFAEVSRLLSGADALAIVKDSDRLAEQLLTLAAEPEKRRAMGVAARQVAEANRGALQRLLQQVDNCYRKSL